MMVNAFTHRGINATVAMTSDGRFEGAYLIGDVLGYVDEDDADECVDALRRAIDDEFQRRVNAVMEVKSC